MERPRIAPLDPPYAEPIAAEFAAIMPPGLPPLALFRVLAHNPRVLQKVRLGSLLDRGALDRRDRELVILRTCARCGAEYEWGVHVATFAARVGLTAAQADATARASIDAEVFAPRDQLLLRLADALHDASDVDDALWRELAAAFTPAQLVELLVLAGFYHSISYVTNAARVPLEAGAPRFPPARDSGTTVPARPV
jgi:alkylhydroperoxidase family enzyme